MANRPKKNKSARDKKVTRQRASSAAKRRDEYPLYYVMPPFEHYKQWFQVPEHAADLIEYPIDVDDEDAQDLLNRLVKLGPRYHGKVPMAAILLDQQLASGEIGLAVTGRPGYAVPMPIAELAATISSQEALDEWRYRYPDAGLPEHASLTTDDAAAWHIHNLHAFGALVMDDDGVMNLVVENPRRGKWVLNGQLDDSDGGE
ncbi:hypothetical protein [Streptomyces sp. NPDC056524]|uniref:hypothetical protein n=1 Tax=Streptomyces sp. NPDC056524 TaxID=3345851 RepID=UPI0036B9C0D1